VKGLREAEWKGTREHVNHSKFFETSLSSSSFHLFSLLRICLCTQHHQIRATLQSASRKSKLHRPLDSPRNLHPLSSFQPNTHSLVLLSLRGSVCTSLISNTFRTHSFASLFFLFPSFSPSASLRISPLNRFSAITSSDSATPIDHWSKLREAPRSKEKLGVVSFLRLFPFYSSPDEFHASLLSTIPPTLSDRQSKDGRYAKSTLRYRLQQPRQSNHQLYAYPDGICVAVCGKGVPQSRRRHTRTTLE